MPAIDYDAIAHEYGQHRRVHPEVLRRLLLDAPIERGSCVLEVGCGTGNYTAAIHRAAGCTCWGVDPSTAMLAQARLQCSEATFRNGRAEALGVPSIFDLVFSVDVIHHVADLAAYFRAAASVLVPNGRLCTVTDSEEIIRTRRPLSVYFPETVDVELHRYPCLESLQALMRGAGFEALRTTTVEYAYPLADIAPFRDKAFSALHLIPQDAFERGLSRLERDMRSGPVPCVARYVLLWGTQPAP